ncbi:hypothetical protein BC349_12430 [Flavihumibacter stibioxidans]|uniref:NodB homology domain-containing protein n=2 Tax=Flavihumibacter stibioxidans TaxID=1834163 RepID=A0ABR7MAV9_9BACT|nr:hypothetical protein [Flavihumibacter stibioxidans]
MTVFAQQNKILLHTKALENLVRQSASRRLTSVLDDPGNFRYQFIYTRIDRDKNNQPRFHHQYLRVDSNAYFNPASMVKLPTALLALEQLHEWKEYGVDVHSTMLTDSAFSGQTVVLADSTSANGLPSVAHYTRKIFVVSDNDAYNRLYELVGQGRLNSRLKEMGYSGSRITRRFVSMSEEENRHSNPIRFMNAQGRLLYRQPAAYNTGPFDFSRKILVGEAHYNRFDSLINAPMDFTAHNVMPLQHLQQMMQAVIFPGSMPLVKRFRIDSADRRLVLENMARLPSETDFPRYDTTEFFDSYTKFFLFRDGKLKPPAHIRSFGKSGWSFGYLTEVAYIVDFVHNIEFMLSGTIYVNSDGVLNDNKYDYDSIGYPFFREMGEIIYRHELNRPRKHQPDLAEFRELIQPAIHPSGATRRVDSPQAIIRGDTGRKEIAIVFTGHDFANGGDTIQKALANAGVNASFFLTGDFYRQEAFSEMIRGLKHDGHYLGAHSDKHLLYADWVKRDSLLVTRKQFAEDLLANEKEMARFGIDLAKATYFLPPYEWYNDSIVAWTHELGRQLVNYTPGTISHADYTSPEDKNYRNTPSILQSIRKKEAADGLNGFILLMHIGATPRRPDPLFNELPQVIDWLKQRGYRLVRIDELLR